MPEQDGIKMAEKAIADSKKLLASTGPKGSSSIATKSGRTGVQKPAPASAAPAPKAASSGLLEATGHSQAPALKEKTDNIDAYMKAVPKMHKGGEVKEDGLKNLQEGEVVIPKEKAEEGKKVLALKKKAKGPMSAAVEEEKNEPKSEEKKETKKEEKAEGEHKPAEKKKKSGKKVKGMHVRRATSGGFIVKHDMDASAEPTGKPMEQEEHVIPDIAALHDHMEQHMGDEEAAAPAAQAAPAEV
jgi:hypothetical protein